MSSHQARFESRDERNGRTSVDAQASPFLSVASFPKLFVARQLQLDLEGREGGRVAEEGSICGDEK